MGDCELSHRCRLGFGSGQDADEEEKETLNHVCGDNYLGMERWMEYEGLELLKLERSDG